MKRLMEYKIISGYVEEKRQAYFPYREKDGPVKRRGIRVKGGSGLRKIINNEREAVKRLARVINCNFRPGDLWLVLRYSDERLPESRSEAVRLAKAFLRRMARQYNVGTGRKLRWVMVTSDKNPRSGESARLHHHLVMDGLAYEWVIKNWPAAELSYSRLDGRLDYTGIARYMCANAESGDDKKRWTCSRGLKKPLYTEPVPCGEWERLRAPRGAIVREENAGRDAETGTYSAYIRYVRADKLKKGRLDSG